MRAGARHSTPHAWRVARLLATPAVIACCAILPSPARAAVSLPLPTSDPVEAVETAVTTATQPVNHTMQPDAGGEQHPVADAVAPIAHAAAAPVASSPVAVVAPKRLDERAHPPTSHITASSSGKRMSSGQIAHGHGSDGVTSPPSSERGAPAHRVGVALMEGSSAPTAASRPASAQPAVQGLSPATSAPGAAASGGSGGFFFGGGFALLVASLLVAGPRLRRQLAQLPAVCRPAAFLVVLERPG
jgi:hypothetical protein